MATSQLPLQDAEEREANYFAMCLLMPEQFVRDEIAKMDGLDLVDDRQLEKLAKKFKVSMGMMAMRLEQVFKLNNSF